MVTNGKLQVQVLMHARSQGQWGCMKEWSLQLFRWSVSEVSWSHWRTTQYGLTCIIVYIYIYIILDVHGSCKSLQYRSALYVYMLDFSLEGKPWPWIEADGIMLLHYSLLYYYPLQSFHYLQSIHNYPSGRGDILFMCIFFYYSSFWPMNGGAEKRSQLWMSRVNRLTFSYVPSWTQNGDG